MKNLFNKGDIVVATRQQSTGCGIVYIRSGSILRVANDVKEDDYDANVYRNQKAEREENTHYIAVAKLRHATPEEAISYNCENYFINA